MPVINYREIRENGGFTTTFLSKLHERAHDNRRRIDWNTHSEIMWGARSRCPHPTSDEHREYNDKRYTHRGISCPHCCAFDISLHNHHIGTVLPDGFKLNGATLLDWTTRLTINRLNKLLFGLPYVIWTDKGVPYLMDYEFNLKWLIMDVTNPILRPTGSPSDYASMVLVGAPFDPPDIEEEWLKKPWEYTEQQVHLAHRRQYWHAINEHEEQA